MRTRIELGETQTSTLISMEIITLEPILTFEGSCPGGNHGGAIRGEFKMLAAQIPLMFDDQYMDIFLEDWRKR